MIKRIVLVLLFLVAAYGAVASPYSLVNTLDTKAQLETAISDQKAAKDTRDAAKSRYVSAKNAYESERTFDIHYTDLPRMKQLIDSVTGISFYSLSEVDPSANYLLGAPVDLERLADGTAELPRAVSLSLVAEDTAAGLRIVDKLELPIVSMSVTEPGRIEIIFLTGGES